MRYGRKKVSAVSSSAPSKRRTIGPRITILAGLSENLQRRKSRCALWPNVHALQIQSNPAVSIRLEGERP